MGSKQKGQKVGVVGKGVGLGRVGEQYEGRVGLRRLGKLWGRGGPGESWGAVGKGGWAWGEFGRVNVIKTHCTQFSKN